MILIKISKFKLGEICEIAPSNFKNIKNFEKKKVSVPSLSPLFSISSFALNSLIGYFQYSFRPFAPMEIHHLVCFCASMTL
jgi:hypothetical protein